MFLFPQPPVYQPYDGVAYTWLANTLSSASQSFPQALSLVVFALLFSQAIMINTFINNLRLFPKPNYLPGMSYLLLSSLFLDWQRFSAPMLITTFLILVWYKTCSLYNNQSPKGAIFNLGFVLGIGALIFIPVFLFILLLVIGLLIFRPFKLPEWLIAVLGFLTPFYILYSVKFLNAGNLSFDNYQTIIYHVPHFAAFNWKWTGVLLALVLLFAGFFLQQKNMRRQVVHARKCWALLYWYFLIAFMITFFGGEVVQNWILAIAPLSALVAAAFFYFPNKWISMVLSWALLLFVIAINYRML